MTAGADKPGATTPLEPQVNALNLNSADLVSLSISRKPPATGEGAVTQPAGTTTTDVGPPAVVSTQSRRRSGVAASELDNPNPQAPKIVNPDGTTTDATPHWNIQNTNPAAAAEVQQAEANRQYQIDHGLNPNGTNNTGSDGLAAANPQAAALATQQAQLADPHSDLNAALRLRAPLNNPYGYSPGWEQFFAQPVVGAMAGFAAGGPIPYLLAKAANRVDSSRRNPYDTIMENGHNSTYATISNQLRGELGTTQEQITALEARSLKGAEAHRFDVLTARTDAMDILCPTTESAEKRLDAVRAASAEAERRMGKDFALFSPEEFELLHSRIKTPPSAMQDHWSSEIEQFAKADRAELASYEALKAAGGSSDPAGLDAKIDRLKTREQLIEQLDTSPQAMARRAEHMPPGLLTADELDIAKQAGSSDVHEVRQAIDHMRQLQAADHQELSALEARFSRADRDELARLTQRRDALAGVLPEQGRTSAELSTAAQTALDRNAAAGGRLLSADEARLIKEQQEALEKLKPTQRSDQLRAWFGNTVREGMFNQTPLSQRLASEQAAFYSAHQQVQGFVSADAQTLQARDAAARARTTTPDVATLNAETIERDRLRTRTELFTAGTAQTGRVNPAEMEQALATAKGDKRALFSDSEIAAMEARLTATRSVALTERQLTPSFWSARNPELGKREFMPGPLGNAAKGALAATVVDMGENYANAMLFHDNKENGLGNLLNAGIFTPLAVGSMFHNKEQAEGTRGNLATRKWAQYGALPLLAWGAGKGIDAILPRSANPDQYSWERATLTPTALSNGIVAGAATLPLRPGLRWKVETAAVLGSMAINYLTNSGDDHYRQAHAADDATAADQREKSGSSMSSAIDKWEVIGNARSQYIADKVQVFGYQHGKDTGTQIQDDRRASVIMRTALGEVQLAKGFSNANAPYSDSSYRDEGFSGNPMDLFTRSFDRRDSTQQIQDANHILGGLNLDLGSQALTNFQMSLTNIQRLEAADGSQTSGLEETKARINKNIEKIYGAHDIPKAVDGLIAWIKQGQNGKDAEVERESIGNQIQAQEQAMQHGQAVDQRALAKACRDYALISVALAKGNTAAGATDAAGFSRDVNNYLAKSQQYYPQDNADILAIQQINAAAAARGGLNQQNSSGSPLKGL